MEPIVETKNLRVEFRAQSSGQAKKVAVKDLNLSIRAGEVFGFLGPNGAGKTTTMNVLLGFVNATSGAAFLFGVDVREPIARQRIGYLPELTYYYKFLTAEELLRFYARIFGIPRAEADRRIDQLLKLVELESARKRPIKTYSKGMQQRVGNSSSLGATLPTGGNVSVTFGYETAGLFMVRGDFSADSVHGAGSAGRRFFHGPDKKLPVAAVVKLWTTSPLPRFPSEKTASPRRVFRDCGQLLQRGDCGVQDRAHPPPPDGFSRGDAGTDSSFQPMGNDGPPDPDADHLCGNESLQVLSDATNLYFIVNRSASMTEMFGTETKSLAMRIAAVSLVRRLGAEVNIGAAMFPGPAAADGLHPCSTGSEVFPTQPGDPAPDADSQSGSVTTAFSNAIGLAPLGGTPTAATVVALPRSSPSPDARTSFSPPMAARIATREQPARPLNAS